VSASRVLRPESGLSSIGPIPALHDRRHHGSGLADFEMALEEAVIPNILAEAESIDVAAAIC